MINAFSVLRNSISRCYSTVNPRVIRLDSGLVHIRGAFSISQQIELVKAAFELGQKEGQGWEAEDGLNCTPFRGRVFKEFKAVPAPLQDASKVILQLANQVDSTLRLVEPTHMILLKYLTLPESPKYGYIPWHRDNGENDGKGDFPVVSINLGESCHFLMCKEKPQVGAGYTHEAPKNLAYRIRLNSGDGLVFGGLSRYYYHAIYDLIPNTCPEELPLKGVRINATFRYAPEILGREEEFAVIEKNISKNNRFYDITQSQFSVLKNEGKDH